jgi:DNA-binding transcriptional MerR regulator
MRHPVEKERGRKYIGLPEFALAGERVLSELSLEQERGTVTSLPDERTIRYYLAEGLIQAPQEKQGTASVFGYLNLLQLVVVKKLQAENLPIRKIRELVAAKNEDELEKLLGIAEPLAERKGFSAKRSRESEAKRYLESLLTSSIADSSPMETQTLSRPLAAGRAKRMASSSAPAPPAQENDTASWQRVEIEPGLELHIRSDYAPPMTSASSRSLSERIRDVINRYWRPTR